MLLAAHKTCSSSCHPRPLQQTPSLHNRPLLAPRRPSSRSSTRATAAQLDGLAPLLLSSTLPVIKIGVVASMGAAAARHGMLNVDARRALSELAINVFTPALMISKLGAHIDLGSALSLWYIGANVILCHLVGLALGMLHTRLLPTPPNLTHIIQVSSSIANTGNLPLVLVLSLIKSPDLPFAANTAAQADTAVSYIMLGLWYATLVQMPLGTLLLHKPPADSTSSGSSSSTCSGRSVLQPPQGACNHCAAAWMTAVPSTTHLQQLLQQARQGSAVAANKQHQHQQSAHITARPATPAGTALLERPPVMPAATASLASLQLQLQLSSKAAQQEWELAKSSSSSSAGSPTLVPMHPPLNQQQQHRQADATQLGVAVAPSLLPPQEVGWRQQWDIARGPLVKGALSAPVIAGILAIMIGSCPPLQAELFTPRGSLSWVGDVLDMLGQPLVPILLLVLGANLSNGPQLANGAHLPPLNVAGVIGSKLVFSPMLGLAVVLGAQKAGLLGPDGGRDSLAALVMAVAWATPTAVLVHSLSLVHKNGEDEVSALLFYEYIAAALTLPLCGALYLYVLGCCVPNVA